MSGNGKHQEELELKVRQLWMTTGPNDETQFRCLCPRLETRRNASRAQVRSFYFLYITLLMIITADMPEVLATGQRTKHSFKQMSTNHRRRWFVDLCLQF